MQKIKKVVLGDMVFGSGAPLVLIAGPCVIESESVLLRCAEFLAGIAERFALPLVFKASYDKANRSSVHSFRGPGLEKGLALLARIKKEFGLPLVTDVHKEEDFLAAAEVVDMVQVPAFLCRQTDLLLAAAATDCVVNIKKGQFVAPYDMKNGVEKVVTAGNQRVIVTERGYSFGYNNLVSDMRSIFDIKQFCPVVYDATHSVQSPGGLGATTGGERKYIPTLVRSAVAAGADALFMEIHPEPEKGLSDAGSMYPFSMVEQLLAQVVPLSKEVRAMGDVW